MSKRLQLRVAGVIITLLAGIMTALQPGTQATKKALELSQQMCSELEAEDKEGQ